MVIITLPTRLVSTVKLDYNANNNTFRAERAPIKIVRRGGHRHDKMHLLSHWPTRDRPHTCSQWSLWLGKKRKEKEQQILI